MAEHQAAAAVAVVGRVPREAPRPSLSLPRSRLVHLLVHRELRREARARKRVPALAAEPVLVAGVLWLKVGRVARVVVPVPAPAAST